MSGFWAVPRRCGCSGFIARRRNASTASHGMIFAISSYGTTSTLEISCEVRNPSKNATNGTFDLSAEMCATIPRSMTSWTDADARRAKPV